MMTYQNRSAIVWRSALSTTATLVGGLLVGVLTGSLVHFGLPGSMAEAWRVGIAVVPALGGTLAGGALWGRVMAGLTGSRETHRMIWAGGLSFSCRRSCAAAIWRWEEGLPRKGRLMSC